MSGSMLPRRYRVTENRRETADTRTLSLAPLDAPIPRFRSGQFTMVYLFGVGEIPLVLGLLFCSPQGLIVATAYSDTAVVWLPDANAAA